MAVYLTAAVAISAVLRFIGAVWVPAPYVVPDELIYAKLAESLYHSGRLDLLGEPTPFYSLITPALIGLPLLLPLEIGYTVIKGVQALVMSLVAVPVYLWGRSFMPPRSAMLAALLSLAIPSLAYSGLILADVVFFPLVVTALWRMSVSLTHPTARNQVVFVLVFMLAASTKLQALVLLPAFATVLLWQASRARSPRPLVQQKLAIIAFAGMASTWITMHFLQTGNLTGALGGYRAAAQLSYEPLDIVRWIGLHAGILVLVSGIVPACGFIFASLDSFAPRDRCMHARAYVMTSWSVLAWSLVVVGGLTSAESGRIAERYVFSLTPLIFLGFSLWISSKIVKSAPVFPGVLMLIGVGIILLPVKRLIHRGGEWDALSLMPFYWLSVEAPEVPIQPIIAIIVLVALVITATLRAEHGGRVVMGLLLVFGVNSTIASARIVRQASELEKTYVGSDRRWVDNNAMGTVAFIVTPNQGQDRAYRHLFWNRRISGVYRLDTAQHPVARGPFLNRALAVDPDGEVSSTSGNLSPDYVVTDGLVAPEGIPLVGAHDGGLMLWRVAKPLRLMMWTDGVFENGGRYEIPATARVRIYRCPPGDLRFALQRDAGVSSLARVSISRDGSTQERISVRPGQMRRGAVVNDRPKSRCLFTLSSSAPLQLNRLFWVSGGGAREEGQWSVQTIVP